jgi:hypothetical protein
MTIEVKVVETGENLRYCLSGSFVPSTVTSRNQTSMLILCLLDEDSLEIAIASLFGW